jgi:hypothetical protein
VAGDQSAPANLTGSGRPRHLRFELRPILQGALQGRRRDRSADRSYASEVLLQVQLANLERSSVVSSGMIAGFGFSTIQRRDLSDLDEILARIEDLGATRAKLSLGGADLVCGGRIPSRRVDRLVRICARHRLAYTVPGPLAANFNLFLTITGHDRPHGMVGIRRRARTGTSSHPE